MTGYARALALFVLLAGIAIMHSTVVAPNAHASMSHAEHSVMTMPGSDHQNHDSGCPGGGCDTSGVLHGCVFVLTGIALALALALLYWVGTARRDDLPVRFQWRRVRRARPPPWTVPTLADLAILRI